MPTKIQCVDYFYATVPDRPGEAFRLLSALASQNVNLLAFTAIPLGPTKTQLALFPEDGAQLTIAAKQAGLALEGPHSALLIQGKDAPGALAKVHERLYEADVNVYAAMGVVSGSDRFGYIVYVRPEQYQAAADALGIAER